MCQEKRCFFNHNKRTSSIAAWAIHPFIQPSSVHIPEPFPDQTQLLPTPEPLATLKRVWNTSYKRHPKSILVRCRTTSTGSLWCQRAEAPLWTTLEYLSRFLAKSNQANLILASCIFNLVVAKQSSGQELWLGHQWTTKSVALPCGSVCVWQYIFKSSENDTLKIWGKSDLIRRYNEAHLLKRAKIISDTCINHWCVRNHFFIPKFAESISFLESQRNREQR